MNNSIQASKSNIDDARTIIVSQSQPGDVPFEETTFDVSGWGVNPILNAAMAPLTLAVRLRGLSSDQNASSDQNDSDQNDSDQNDSDLRLLVINEIKMFEQALDGHGYDRATILAARYALCAMLDEAALATNWGTNWGINSLLSHFYNETWGGEKFFLILARLLQEPARHRDMIEFLYVGIRLGFQGKYAVTENGQSKLEILGENVHNILRRMRGDEPVGLADRWKIREHRQPRLMHWVSLRLMMIVTSMLLIGGYVWLNMATNDDVKSARKDLESIIAGGHSS